MSSKFVSGFAARFIVSLTLAHTVGAQAQVPSAGQVPAPAAAGHAAFNGVWLVADPAATLRTENGAAPPLTAKGQAQLRQFTAARAAGRQTADPTNWCASPGIPRLLSIHYPFEIMVRPAAVVFQFEWDRWARFVDTTGIKLEVVDPSSMGVSSGRWDGDTLVIRTKGFRENTLLDNGGLPHGDKLVVSERLRVIAPDILEDVIEIADADFYTRSWRARITYRRQAATEIEEDVCLDRVSMGQPAIAGN